MIEAIVAGALSGAICGAIISAWICMRVKDGPMFQESQDSETIINPELIANFQPSLNLPLGNSPKSEDVTFQPRKPWRIRKHELEAAARTRRAKIESFQE